MSSKVRTTGTRDLARLNYDQKRAVLTTAMQRAVQGGDYDAVRYVAESIVALEAVETAQNELTGRLTHLAQKYLILVPSAAEVRRESSAPSKSTSSTKRVTLHDDGNVTYWSVYNQIRTRSSAVPDRELAAMNESTRERVKAHLAKHSGGES